MPKKPADLGSLARAYTDVCAAALGGYVTCENTDPDVKLRAIQQLLDRGWGRPISKTEVGGVDGSNTIEVTLRTIVEGKK